MRGTDETDWKGSVALAEKTEPRLSDGDSEAHRELRARAERKAARLDSLDTETLDLPDARRLIHELHVHQIELELQNEELRRAQLALDTARARYFDLYDLAPVGYLTLDERGDIQQANLRASTMLGTERGALVRHPLTRHIVAEDQDTYYKFRKQLLATGLAQVCELRLKRPDDTQLWARLEATSSVAAASGQVEFRLTFSDISEARDLHAKLAQTDRMASLGLLAASVAHEINNPLTYVLFHLESLSEDLPGLPDGAPLDPGKIADLAERASQALIGVQRIHQIARGLSSFARVDPAVPTPIDLHQAIEGALEMTAGETRYRARLFREFGHLPAVLAPEGKLSQVFLNLILNATQSMDEGEVKTNRITIRTWAEQNRIFAEVSDTGCGISPENLGRVFDPFFTTKAPNQGTGLGLTITRRILSELGGDIRIDSGVGGGTRVTIQLPAAPAAPEIPPATVTTPQTVRGRVLVIDDDEGVRSTFQLGLARDHEVVAVDSGRAALELLAIDQRFDLVICDLMMPEVAGIDVHAWIVESCPQLSDRVMFVTGGVFTPRTAAYLKGLSNPQLQKPVSIAQLRSVVAQRILASREEN
jgi:PAS domain S-box-containing protein